MRLLLAALTLAASAAAAPADDKDAKSDLDKLQGKWKAMVGPNKDIPFTLVVKDKTASVTITTPDGQERSFKGEVKLDEKKSPKQIDWVKFTRPDGTEAEANLGIYELKGDEFKVCNGGPGNSRPTEFKAGEMGPPNLILFTRAKDEEKKDSK
jgi:uncharacterized protein (TIGR03067 family)